MNDTVLLMTGLSVFGLMIIAIILTVAEFRQLGKREDRQANRKSGGSEDSG